MWSRLKCLCSNAALASVGAACALALNGAALPDLRAQARRGDWLTLQSAAPSAQRQQIEQLVFTGEIDSIRPKHREYLNSLLANGQLACSGPFTNGYGALIVYEAETLEDAEKLIRADPFHDGGVFVKWEVRPWKMVFANANLFTTG